MEPIYRADNTRAAYQLLWSLTLFWKTPFPPDGWVAELSALTESDGVRVLLSAT